MSKNNRSVRPRLRTAEPSPLDLARRTGLNCAQIRRLAQALRSPCDVEETLYRLPLRSLQPFLIAAFLNGFPVPLEKVLSAMPKLDDPFSAIRIIAVTSGDRISALLDLVDTDELEPVRVAMSLYFCVDLLEGGPVPQRLIESLKRACGSRNTFLSSILLRDIAVRLEITDLLRLTRSGAAARSSPMGQIAAARLRHMIFEPPLTGLPEEELAGAPLDALVAEEVPDVPTPFGQFEVVQSIKIPAHHLAEVNPETLDSETLLKTLSLLSDAQMWEAAERALDELIYRGANPRYRQYFADYLMAHGQTAMASRQVNKSERRRHNEPAWVNLAA